MHAKDRALSSAGGSSAKSAGARASVRPGASGACAGSAGAGASASTSTSGAGARSAAARASATTSAFGATAGSARGQASASTSAGGASARSAGGGGLCERQRERSKCKACRERFGFGCQPNEMTGYQANQYKSTPNQTEAGPYQKRGQILKSEHFKPCRTVGKPGVPGTPLSNRETTEHDACTSLCYSYADRSYEHSAHHVDTSVLLGLSGSCHVYHA